MNRWRPGWLSILLPLPIALIPSWADWLQFDRSAISGGQVWRLLSGHWTHWSSEHLFWSGGAFVVLAAVGWRDSRGRVMACIVVSALAISAGIWIGTDLRLYRGLSGIDSALFMMIAVETVFRRIRNGETAWVGAMLVLGFLAKTGYEAVTGRAIFVASEPGGMVPVPLAHGLGAVVGVIMAVPRARGCHRWEAEPRMSSCRFRSVPVADDTATICKS